LDDSKDVGLDRTLAAALLAAVLFGGVASCTPSRPRGSESLRTEGTSAPSSAPAPTTTTTTSPADPSLVPGLLTVAELPAGYQVDDTGADPGGFPFIPSSSCYGVEDPTLGISPVQTAARTYGPDRPSLQVVVETIDRYRLADAVALLAHIRQAVQACVKSPRPGMQLVPQAQPFGDDSLSIEVLFPGAYVGVVRVGNLVAVVQMWASGADVALLATVAARLHAVR
jgi:hypothetical protein